MSTKATLAHGPLFHLYREVFDDSCINLTLTSVYFVAGPDEITVAIPIEFWEVIRQFSSVDLSLAEKSEDELAAIVKELMTEQANSLLAGIDRPKHINNLYSSSQASYDERLTTYKEMRERQIDIKKKISELQSLQTRSGK
jgi:hypothetical protein